MRRFVYLLYFVAFTSEGPTTYCGLWKTPLGYVDDILFRPSPIKVPIFQVITLVCLLVASAGSAARKGRAQPMDRAMWGTLATLVLFTIWGAFLGGKPWMAGWQLFTLIMCMLFGKVLSATMRTPEHFETLGKVLLAAAFYRAAMCVLFWFIEVHNVYYPKGPPPHMTTHDDTVLFVLAIIIGIVNAVVRRTSRSILFSAGTFLVMVLAIQLNNRRLAWVSLALSLVVVYLMLPQGKVRRRFNIALVAMMPVVGTYVAVGWDRPEKVFKPLRSLSTMTTHEDSSTRARKAENKGLHMTLLQGGWIAGRGWGQEYIEVDNRYSIAGIYKEWKYIPHNSLFGILAFTGVIGFSGVWVSVIVSAYLNARTWRYSRRPVERVAGLGGLGAICICMNQMYGDMGLQSITTQMVLVTTYATATRLSVSSGAWAVARSPRPAGAATARAPLGAAAVEGSEG